MFLHWSGNNLDLSQGYSLVYSSAGGTGAADIFDGRISIMPNAVITENTDLGTRPVVVNNLGQPFRHCGAASGHGFIDGAGSSDTVAAFQISNNQATFNTISGSQPSIEVRNIHMESSAEFVALALNNDFSGNIPFFVYRRSGTTWTRQTLDVPVNPNPDPSINYDDYQIPFWCSVRKYSSTQVYVVWSNKFGVGLGQKFNGTVWSNLTSLSIDDRAAVDWNPQGNVIVYGRDNSGAPLSSTLLDVRTFNTGTDTVTSGPSITQPTTTQGLVVRAIRWSPNGEYLVVTYNESPGCAVYKFNGSFTKLSSPFDVDPGSTGSNNDISWTADSNYVQIAGSTYARSGDSFVYLGSLTWNSKFL